MTVVADRRPEGRSRQNHLGHELGLVLGTDGIRVAP